MIKSKKKLVVFNFTNKKLLIFFLREIEISIFANGFQFFIDVMGSSLQC